VYGCCGEWDGEGGEVVGFVSEIGCGGEEGKEKQARAGLLFLLVWWGGE
jgi:hypothetical protein